MEMQETLNHSLLNQEEGRRSGTVAVCLLLAAIVSEVIGTTCMKLTQLSEWWRVMGYVCYAFSFSLFPTIIQRIPLSVAYATWSAMGTASIALVSVVFFDETLNRRQVFATCGILVSVVLLQEW